jgi:preprotein translocase subunit SecG
VASHAAPEPGVARAPAGADRVGTPPLARQRPLQSTPMELIFSVIQVVIAIVLIFLVLMHSGKDAGLSGAFGVGTGQGPLGGGSLVERNLNRWTIGFAIAFAINTIVLLKKPW